MGGNPLDIQDAINNGNEPTEFKKDGESLHEKKHKDWNCVSCHDWHGAAGNPSGEDRGAMRVAVEAAAPTLPPDRPRYLMGVGTPRDFFDAIAAGIDLFDCVTPTRHGRNHQVWTSRGRINLRNAGWKDVDMPLDETFRAPHVGAVPIGVLRHLAITNEMVGATYLTMHNLHLFHELMRLIREAIPLGQLAALRDEWVPRLERRIKPEAFIAGDV